MAECKYCGNTFLGTGDFCSQDCNSTYHGNKTVGGAGCGLMTLFVALLGMGSCAGAYQGLVPWWGWILGFALFSLAGKLAKSRANPLNQ